MTSHSQQGSRANLADWMRRRILILDGAMGTMLQQHQLTESDFGGPEYEGCNEYLTMTRPDIITSIHEAYLDAGADIIETNTFGATPVVLAEYGLEQITEELNFRSAELARAAADGCSTEDRPRFVAGSVGPTTKSLSVTGGITFDELSDGYYVQARGLIRGGVDALFIETSQDVLNVKAAAAGIRRAQEELGESVPVVVSGTIEPMGTTLAGQTIEALYAAVEHLKPLAVGLNCATGPEFMRDHVRALSGLALTGVSCYPNAGLPDENGHYHESPAAFARKLTDFADQGWMNIVGGCCGTTPDHIRALSEAMEGKVPRAAQQQHPHMVSGLEPVYLESDNRPILVGERTNVIGSRKFKKLIADGQFESAAEVARTQVKSGAQVIDICLADPDRDELEDMGKFLPFVVRKVKAPLMIDSTDARVVELALQHSQGKAIINSTNLEDGEQRLAQFARLATTYGAALVVGTIDERGMAVTSARKLDVALRSVDLLTQKYGLKAQDLIIDPLTFPVGTGDENYLGAAAETVEGIRLLKQHLPDCPMILGVSNVSFGLPPAGREVLNSVFLYHCTRAGLDYAIVNTEKLERFASISEVERALAEKVLFATSEQAVAEFTAFYREKRSVAEKQPEKELPLLDRLARCVVEGSKEGLVADLEEARMTMSPLDIINGPLMDGMSEVGRLFNNNELIVAEVLQSAEVMKAAVAHLEPFMEKAAVGLKGKILLATVKGDVHDIGKNLVEIILSNNGYDVINLGIKVPPEQLVEAYRQHHPDMIGLSGLLVKSAQQMVTTADDLSNAGISAPLLVGGAALTKKFSLTKIAPSYSGPVFYAKDAMEGLELANRWGNVERRDELLSTVESDRIALSASQSADRLPGAQPLAPQPKRTSSIDRHAPVFVPPDKNRHVLRDYPVAMIRPYLNWQMLIGKHLGYRGNVEKGLAENDGRLRELMDEVSTLLDAAEREALITAHAVYQFFPANSDGDDVLICDPADETRVIERFRFPRQTAGEGLCLADYLRPVTSGDVDYVAMFAVTTGHGIRHRAEAWKQQGDYLRSHALQAVALELAEALAERVHEVIRGIWGFPDPVDLSMRERFTAKYQGIRVSFGYPACPNLEDQTRLFRLLHPEDIGIHLTDGFMMDPEASVSALVLSHPQARYFNVNAGQDD